MLRIISNHHERAVIDASQLSADERAEFDYVNWGAIERGEDSRSFARYKGELYDLSDTEGTFPADRRWFYISDSFFSGVLFRYATDERGEPDADYIICGRYYA